MLSYALGRTTLSTDEPALQKLDACLLENNFNP
jgi:triphosphoribosyl-dephospho-CoA synthetase